MVLVVHLPTLMRGHAIQTQIKEEFLKLRVPNLYKLELGLPVDAEEEDAYSFFDCKIRRLICVIPVKQPRFEEIVEETAAPEIEIFEATDIQTETPKIVEISPEPVAAQDEDDDLLFDII